MNVEYKDVTNITELSNMFGTGNQKPVIKVTKGIRSNDSNRKTPEQVYADLQRKIAARAST